MSLSSFLKRGAKIGAGGIASASIISAAATAYVYETDESWRRCIDFHAGITPLCWDYWKFYTFRPTSTAQEREKELAGLHEKYAPEVLSLILDLGGYYVKCGQMFCGMGLLPEAYERTFSCLLDGVPAKPFEVIERIVQEELGGRGIADHFSFFEKSPIAAASIGQVHRAKLLGEGERGVVVKVQYPEVERYFRLDVLSMQNLCHLAIYCGIDIGMDEKSLDKMFREFTKSFAEEFDYRLEADNMSLIADNMANVPRFKNRISVPRPIPAKTTKKVLTMTRLNGEPIQKRMNRMMQEWADREGKTIIELEEEMRAKLDDPSELQKLMSQRPPSSLSLSIIRAWMRIGDCVANTRIWFRNRLHSQQLPYRWSTLPLDASKIVSLLFDVHGHQLFMDGAFNGDPHAGNILLCDNPDGSYTLGLVDFGNVQKIPTLERQKQIARFYLAMSEDVSEDRATWNDEAIAQAFVGLVGETTMNDTSFLAANALIGYDMRYDAATLDRFGIRADFSNIGDLYASGDSFSEFPADLINLQRLCQTLVGVASGVGAGSPSCSRMWRRQCEAVTSDQE